LGIDDPEKWLANADKRVVKTWEAYWRLEPWGQPWHRHASMMMMLNAIYAMVVSWIGGDAKKCQRKFADWMPGDWVQDVEKAESVDLVGKLDAFVRATSR
jgi:hypothetical protein